MELSEAIKHCEEKAKELKEEAHSYSDDERYSGAEADCLECANEHKQLAEWLKELYAVREIVAHWNDEKSNFVAACEAFEKILAVIRIE